MLRLPLVSVDIIELFRCGGIRFLENRQKEKILMKFLKKKRGRPV